MSQDLIIIGASGFGRHVAWLVERINAFTPTWNVLGFLDDNPHIQGKVVVGYSVLGKSTDALNYPHASFVCAIGASKVRRAVVDKLPGLSWATLIEPSVIMSSRVAIGEGSIICAGTILVVDIALGKHVILNMNCTVGHDAILKDFVTAYPSVNISGNTVIGDCTELGTGTQIIQGKHVGRETIVGAGSVVIGDIPDHCTAVGVPAKPIKFSENY